MADGNVIAWCYPNPAIRTPRLAVKELRHWMAPFQHDTITAYVQGATDTDSNLWSTGTPLRFQYGRYPNQIRNFYGYVLSTSRTWAQTQGQSSINRLLEVNAIGASYPLKDGYQGVFNNVTSSTMARAVALAAYLDTDIPNTHYVWPSYHVGSTSYWKFLVTLAQRTGVTFFCNDVKLCFYDPTIDLTRGNVSIPTFYERDAGLGAATILQFETSNSETQSVAGQRKRTRIYQGLDSSTQSPLYLSDDTTTIGAPLAARKLTPLFSEYSSDLVARHATDAQYLLPPQQVANRFHIRAKAQLAGNPAIHQETPVILEGLGSRDSGVWQVLTATAHVKWQYYALDCELGRDSDYDNGNRPGLPANVAPVRIGPAGTPVYNSPPTVLVNGRWRAAWSSKGGSNAA